MITRQNALWLIPLILILSFPLWKIPVASFLAPRGGFDRQFTQNHQVKHNFVMTGVTILHSDKDVQTAQINAVTAHTSKHPNEYILDEVDAEILDEKGNLTTVVAKTGEYNINHKLLKLNDDVIITKKAEDFIMTTDLLFYDGKRLSINCPKKAKLEGDGITVEGSNLWYDMIKGTYTLGGRVLCTVQGHDGS